MNVSGSSAEESQKREMQSACSGGTDSVSSDSGSRKRKVARYHEDDSNEAASALMDLPRKITSKKDSETSSKDNKSDTDHDLSTIEGQQAVNPNMSLEEARFQVRHELG